MSDATPLWRAAVVAAAAAALLGGSPASAQDAAAGRVKAQSCAVCHGMNGISNAPDAPHLAGQPAMYIAAQLRAYKTRTRQHEVMAVMAGSLSDDDIQNLAAWFASIRVEATLP